MKNNIQYLGTEKIPRLLLRFSAPCILGLLIGALYNIIDQIFIGNSELGYLGNAATGASFPVICIANAFAWCVGDGAASYLSICSGKKDADRAHKCVGTGITVSALISLILSFLCLMVSEPLMRLFGASEQTVDMAVAYFQIIAAFFPCYLLLNVMNSMIRADGNPGYAMVAMLSGAIINLILDPVFIFILKWGIAGAAWATVIGQILSFLICAVYFRHPKCFELKIASFIPDREILKQLLSLGSATFIAQISIVVMTLVCNITLAKYGSLSKYGQDIPISIFSIQTKVYTVICNIVTGIVLGGQPIFGYNYGAGKIDRVKQAYRIVLISSVAVGMTATLVFQLCPDAVIGLFGKGDPLYMEFARMTFRVYLSLMTITCLVKLSTVFFQSIGKSFQAIISSLVRDILCFAPAAILICAVLEHENPGHGIYGILLAAPIADIIAGIVIIILTSTFFRLQKASNHKK